MEHVRKALLSLSLNGPVNALLAQHETAWVSVASVQGSVPIQVMNSLFIKTFLAIIQFVILIQYAFHQF